MADWSQLPTELLKLIVGCLETTFDIVHFRSVCSSWRSDIPPPDHFHCLGMKTRNIPYTFSDQPPFNKYECCTLKRIPVFLLRFNTPFSSDYLLAEIRERKSGKPMSMSSPLSNDGITYSIYEKLFNSLTSQIIPFGYYYEITYYQTRFSSRFGQHLQKTSERVEFFQLDGEDCKDFVVLDGMQIFTSLNMSWTPIVGLHKTYQGMVAFKGKFYIVDSSGLGQVFAIEPSSEVTEIPSVRGSINSDQESMVTSGDELLLVQRFIPGYRDDYMHIWFRVFRLDEEEGRMKWVQVNDLNDRVIFLGLRWNLCCSVKELPGTKENCIVFQILDFRIERNSERDHEFLKS